MFLDPLPLKTYVKVGEPLVLRCEAHGTDAEIVWKIGKSPNRTKKIIKFK